MFVALRDGGWRPAVIHKATEQAMTDLWGNSLIEPLEVPYQSYMTASEAQDRACAEATCRADADRTEKPCAAVGLQWTEVPEISN